VPPEHETYVVESTLALVLQSGPLAVTVAAAARPAHPITSTAPAYSILFLFIPGRAPVLVPMSPRVSLAPSFPPFTERMIAEGLSVG
jgi:hypothetical protein